MELRADARGSGGRRGARLEGVDRELEEAEDDAAQAAAVLVHEEAEEGAEDGRGAEPDREEGSRRLLVRGVEGVHVRPLEPICEHGEEVHSKPLVLKAFELRWTKSVIGRLGAFTLLIIVNG